MRKLLVTDDRGTRELLLVGRVAVGRDPACEISVDDPLLSRRHAEFVASANSVELRDLDSRNGLRVNGASTRRAVLRDGDEIRIAGLRITLIDPPGPKPTPAPVSDDEDGTVIMPAPVGDDRTVHMPPPSGAVPSPPSPVPSPPKPDEMEVVTGPPVQTAVARFARTPWSGRVFVVVVGVAMFSAVLVAILMSVWQARVLNSVATARATALVNWLAADAASAIERGDARSAAEAFTREPGVVAAIVAGVDGKVLSPGSRAGETFDTIPGADVAPSEVFGPRSGTSDGVVYVARPVGRDGARQAVAWVAFRPSAGPDGGSVAVVLGPALLVVFAAGMFAALFVRRTTLRGLALMNEDIELAISGQLDAVKDPLGARPIRDLADTVNYLIVRARAAGPMSVASLKTTHNAVRTATASETSIEPAAAGPGSSAEARVVVDAKFRVTSASPECAALIGVSPQQMLGEHLVSALQSPLLAKAVLTCLGEMPVTGERRFVLPKSAQLSPLTIVMTRSGKDQPVSISFRPADSAGVA